MTRVREEGAARHAIRGLRREHADPANERLVRTAAGICPYLVAADGSWRSAEPDRSHRCAAVLPAIPLASDKQRRLCLAEGHLSCPTFTAARDQCTEDGGRWALVRALPVVLDQRHSPASVIARGRSGRGAQLGLALLMVLAFAAVVVARGLGPGAAPAPAASPSLAAVADVTATPAPLPSPSPSPSESPSPVPTSSPSAAPPSPSPVTAMTYRVRSGDTLAAIAGRFGTTVKALQALNGIDNPRLIRIGQVLQIP